MKKVCGKRVNHAINPQYRVYPSITHTKKPDLGLLKKVQSPGKFS